MWDSGLLHQMNPEFLEDNITMKSSLNYFQHIHLVDYDATQIQQKIA